MYIMYVVNFDYTYLIGLPSGSLRNSFLVPDSTSSGMNLPPSEDSIEKAMTVVKHTGVDKCND